jgi:hypothetical protein
MELRLHAEYRRLSTIYVDGLSGGDRQEELGSRLGPSKWRTGLVMSFIGLELLKKGMLEQVRYWFFCDSVAKLYGAARRGWIRGTEYW